MKTIFLSDLYETPHTLGIDRMVLAAAAAISKPNRLVIDAGTCVTYDFMIKIITGWFLPGLRLRYE
jgi:type III pantothenate kinase